MVSVVFPAAGQAHRMQVGLNKVFLTLAGKPMLLRTLLTFSKVKEVGELIVAVGADEVDAVTSLLSRVKGLAPWRVVAGGSERQYSIRNGLALVSEDADIVLVHDAARPLIRREAIEELIRIVREKGAAIIAVPEKNTIKIADEEGVVVSTPPRRTLWQVQTPQGFRREILCEANRRAEEDGFLGTDDASLVERIGVQVHIVKGEYSNIKVTTPEDMIVAEAILRNDMGAGELMKTAVHEAKRLLGGVVRRRKGDGE
ncbi:2-C-methyl-D-erythritol 4-phosphate cytidylyltransferase [uncultured Selenomonas sp.]|uniref:2-C-methyl-D-erythritol 4-phosphate cytidylyltransferase n=1 Tax=uncultured Selenomonas sp. TaxID=159275 RepID=UPI0028D4DF52|nr:2-C-methyl-D-erythritol 4-phosphate cytidylyltransferase [uncultured Selenomonas sp.]